MKKSQSVLLLLFFLMFPFASALAHAITAKGTVTDTAGEPLMGVSVFVKGTSKGTSTDIDGNFTIQVNKGATLTFTYVGFNAKEVTVNSDAHMTVVLDENTQMLQDVVVVGYGTQKKANLTGAVAAVNGDAIANRPVTNVGQALQGVVGNLIVNPGSGAPGQGASFNVRGVTSISGNSATAGQPLVLVDNVQMDPNLVNPDDIESISVLKDGASAYGDDVSDVFVTNSVSSYLFNTMTVNDASGWDFGTIRTCNIFMDHYKNVKGDEAKINQYVGEVRFYRAKLYFNLIKRFGDVPYYDHELKTTDTEELYKARDPRNFVLGKIIEDLEFASKWCVESRESGRPTADAAKTLLARVCLHYGTYMKYHNEAESNGISSQSLLQKAATVTSEIINSGKYDIVKANDPEGTATYPEWPLPYANLFVQDDLHDCAEAILPRYYKVNVVTHEVGRQAGGLGFGLSKAFIESYLMKNGKPIYNEGSGYHGDNTLEEEILDRDPRLWQSIATDRRCEWAKSGEFTMTRWSYALTVNTTAGVTGYPCEKFHSSNQDQWTAKNSYDQRRSKRRTRQLHPDSARRNNQ